MFIKRAQNENRRQFIKQACFVAATLPVSPWGMIGWSGCSSAADRRASVEANMAASQTGCEWCGAAEAPANLTWQTIVAPANEPGERIRISGTVYQPDGTTPAEGIVIYIYHTNAQGVYPKNTPNDGRMSWRHGYLRGWMRTGADGRYEFRTIKPAPYPGGRDPAHIHITISASGYPEYYIENFLFEGDSLIIERERARFERGGFPHIIRLERDTGGELRGTRNIRLRRV